MTKQTFSFDNPHKDIGKQKFRVKKYYNVWVEYDVVADTKDEAENAVIDHGGIQSIDWEEGYHKDEPVEVYASDWNYNDSGPTTKVAECIPYEDSDGIDYEDPVWSTDDYEWKKTGEEPSKHKPKIDEEIPF